MLKYFLWALALCPLAHISTAQSIPEKIDALVEAYASYGEFSGSILVAEKGRVIYKKGVGLANVEWGIPNTPTTKFRVGSVTKQFTAILILQLVSEGRLKLHEPITTWLPYYRAETGDRVTIHHLLTHSSGIPNYTNNPNFGYYSTLYYSVRDFTRLFCSGDLEFEPGTRFSYSNSGFFILGAILEEVTRKTYAKLLQERILDVTGMKNTGYDTHAAIIPERATGYQLGLDGFRNAAYLDMALPYAAGSLYSTVEDLLLWDRALYTEKLLPDSLKKLMFRLHNPIGPGNAGAAYGWFVGKRRIKETGDSVNSIWHTGGINGFGSVISRYPDTERLIVVFDNTEQYRAPEELPGKIMAILSNRPVDMPKPSFAGAVRRKISSSSIEEAADFFNNLSEEQKEGYDYGNSERQINRWGYELLNDRKNYGGAMRMFELNIKAFPQSSNVYDSYAEAMMKAGHHQLAIENYERSIRLDSSNTHATSMISQLLVKTDTITVRVDGHDMNLFVSGKKGPIVVLEAGGASTHECWSTVVPQLSQMAIVVTYDRPGFGESVACTKPRTAGRVTDELRQALQKAGLKGPYIIGGWSWGGAFAHTFARNYPGETAGLLLVDPPLKNAYDRMIAEYPDEYTRIMNIDENPGRHHVKDEYNAEEATMHQAYGNGKTYNGPSVLLIANDDSEWEAVFRPLKRIWVEELQKWGNMNPHMKTEVVPSRHHIAREKPEAVIGAIRELIRKIRIK